MVSAPIVFYFIFKKNSYPNSLDLGNKTLLDRRDGRVDVVNGCTPDSDRVPVRRTARAREGAGQAGLGVLGTGTPLQGWEKG
jgi:hypothetical protein